VAPTSSEKIVVGEVKFQKKAMDYSILAQLERESDLIHWKPTGGGEIEYEYVLFSRNGFTRSLQDAGDEREDIRLYDVDQVVSLLSNDD